MEGPKDSSAGSCYIKQTKAKKLEAGGKNLGIALFLCLVLCCMSPSSLLPFCTKQVAARKVPLAPKDNDFYGETEWYTYCSATATERRYLRSAEKSVRREGIGGIHYPSPSDSGNKKME